MDYTQYINSKDIRAYLKDIRYEFNTLEAAWLIYQCRRISIAQKHAAWDELIRTMPDCRIEERMNTDARESLHSFLKEFMTVQNKCIDRLCADEAEAVFFCRVLEGSDWYDCGEIYSDYEKCREYLKSEFPASKTAQITKQWLNEKCSKYIKGTITVDGTFMDIEPLGILNKRESSILYDSFDGFWFDFPVPFHKGDILHDPLYNSKVYCGGPFVMTAIATSDMPEDDVCRFKENGDKTDMNAWGYFMNQDGSFYEEVTFNYMDCEYYTDELTGREKILKPLSQYVKEELDLSDLCREYAANLLSSRE